MNQAIAKLRKELANRVAHYGSANTILYDDPYMATEQFSCFLMSQEENGIRHYFTIKVGQVRKDDNPAAPSADLGYFLGHNEIKLIAEGLKVSHRFTRTRLEVIVREAIQQCCDSRPSNAVYVEQHILPLVPKN